MNTLSELNEAGFALLPSLLPAEVLTSLWTVDNFKGAASIARAGTIYAVRHLLHVPAVQTLVRSAAVSGAVCAHLGPGAFAVRGILFDKTPTANWKVPWHQDLTITVEDQIDVGGFRAWTRKAGVWHVQPPVPVLEGMLTVRIHIDPCTAEDGALRLVAGSHLNGRLTPKQIEDWRSRGEYVPEFEAGDALLMRPLTLHASSPSRSGRTRRILHVEFAAVSLPGGLRWHEQIRCGS